MQLLNIQLQVEHQRPPLFILKIVAEVNHLAEQLELAGWETGSNCFVFTS